MEKEERMDIDTIRDEMAKLPSGSPVSYVGEYATARVLEGMTVPKGKTLKGAYAAIETYARGHKSGNSACVPDAVAWALVDDYYGWPHKTEDKAATPEPQAFAADTVEETKAADEPPKEKPADPFALPDMDDLW